MSNIDDKRYDRILDILFDLKEDISEIKEETVKNTVTLEEHQRRSLASEARHELQEKKLDKFASEIRVASLMLKVGLTLLSVTATVIGILAAIRNLL
jgi:hypothetical protein